MAKTGPKAAPFASKDAYSYCRRTGVNAGWVAWVKVDR
jgi:hypothetical protein